MTALMTHPVDHWLDLDPQHIRRPLREEMFAAFNEAMDTPAHQTMLRAYLIGIGTGYAVGFGVWTRAALENARRTPAAGRVGGFECRNWGFRDDENTAWACGVLDGYWRGTSERADAAECLQCSQRLTDHDDDIREECEHGVFCDDCQYGWHRDNYFPRACSYLVEQAQAS